MAQPLQLGEVKLSHVEAVEGAPLGILHPTGDPPAQADDGGEDGGCPTTGSGWLAAWPDGLISKRRKTYSVKDVTSPLERLCLQIGDLTLARTFRAAF